MFTLAFFILLLAPVFVFSGTTTVNNGAVSPNIDIPESSYHQFRIIMSSQGLVGRHQFDVYVDMINPVHTMTAYAQWDASASSSSNFYSFSNGIGDLLFSVDLPDSTQRTLYIGVYANNAAFPASTITVDVTITAHKLPLILTNNVPYSPSNPVIEKFWRYFRLPINSSSVFPRQLVTTTDVFNAANHVKGYFRVPEGPISNFALVNSANADSSILSNVGDWTHNILIPSNFFAASLDLGLYAFDCYLCDEITISDITMAISNVPPTTLSNGVEFFPPDLTEGAFAFFEITVASNSQLDIYLDVFNPLNSMQMFVGVGFIPSDTFFNSSNVGESGDLYLSQDVLTGSTLYIAVQSVDCFSCSDITYDITPNIRSFSKTLPLGSTTSSGLLDIYENFHRNYQIPLSSPYSGINILTVNVDIFNSANTITSYLGFGYVPSKSNYDDRSSPGDIGDVTFQTQIPNNISTIWMTVYGDDCPGCNLISLTSITPSLSSPSYTLLQDDVESDWYDVGLASYSFFKLAVPTSPVQVDFRIDLAVDIHTVESAVYFQGVNIHTQYDSGDQTMTVDLPNLNENTTEFLYLRIKGIECLPACNDITLDIHPYIRPYIRDLGQTPEFTDFNVVEGFYRYFMINISSALPSSTLRVDRDLLNLGNSLSLYVGQGYIPNSSNYDYSTTDDTLSWPYNPGAPFFVSIHGDSCPGCSWITLLSFELILESPPMELPLGVEFDPGVDLPEGQFHHYYFTVPNTTLTVQNQLDFDLDVLNPLNTLHFFLNYESIANKTHFRYKQTTPEEGDLESSWLLEPGLWYLGVYAQDCYGCWDITYDVTVFESGFEILVNNTLSPNITSYESYPRAVLSPLIAADSQINLIFDSPDGLAPISRASICAFTFPNHTSGKIILPYVSIIDVESDMGPSKCEIFHTEYGDLSLSIPVISDNTRVLIYVTDLYCEGVCDSLAFDIIPQIVPMRVIPHSVAVSGSSELYQMNSSVHEKWMDYYVVQVVPDLQIMARTYYPVVYTLVNDLYISQTTPPTEFRFLQCATNTSAFALLFPEYPDRSISLPNYESSKWYIGVLGTSCGGLCTDAPYTLEVVTVASLPKSLKSLEFIDPEEQITWIVLFGVGVVFVLASLIALLCFAFRKTELELKQHSSLGYINVEKEKTVKPEQDFESLPDLELSSCPPLVVSDSGPDDPKPPSSPHPYSLYSNHIESSTHVEEFETDSISSDDETSPKVSHSTFEGSSKHRLRHYAPQIIAFLIFVGALILTGLSVDSIVGPVEPEAFNCGTEMTSYDIWDLQASIITYTVLENPNWISGKLYSIHASIYHKDNLIGEGSNTNTTEIPNGERVVLPLPIYFDFDFDSAWDMISDIFESDTHDFNITVNWYAKVGSQDFFGWSYDTTVDGQENITLTPFTPSNKDTPKQCSLVPEIKN